ncbi:MAG: response regulator [bacterium]
MRNKIIVADDSLTVQKVIKLILSPKGYDVESYNNGRDAFNAVKRVNPLLVIADALMPDMNGIELGEAMANDSKQTKSIPLILMHSSFEDIKDESFKRSGAKEKLSKPFEDVQLVDLIEKYIEQTGEDSHTWDMESFVRPEMPDMKNPLKTIGKHGGDVEIEETPIVKVPDNIKIDELGIPDADKFLQFEQQETIVEEEKEFGPELISDDDAKKLMEEFKIKENPDGTINFDDEIDRVVEDATRKALERVEKLSVDENDVTPEHDVGMWSEKYYDNIDHIATNLNLDNDSEEIPELIRESDSAEERFLVREITREVVEKMVRELLPDIAERVIREEIKKIVSVQ